MRTTQEILHTAKAAIPQMIGVTEQQKNDALKAMADAMLTHRDEILAANAADVSASNGTMRPVMLDRLRLDDKRLAGMAQGIREVAALPDPVGRTLDSHRHPNGMLIEKVAVPLGVVGIIYESRPNVTADAAALAIKSGNVCVLRGGKEAFRSASAIVSALRDGLQTAGITPDAINLIEDTTRESAREMMTADGLIDIG